MEAAAKRPWTDEEDEALIPPVDPSSASAAASSSSMRSVSPPLPSPSTSSRKVVEPGKPHPGKRKRIDARERCASGTRVVIDMAYWSTMDAAEQRSLKTQIKDAYGAVMRGRQPMRLVLVGLTVLLPEILASLNSIGGFSSWACDRLEASLDQFLKPGESVFLSPDATDVLTLLDAAKTYVLGGIVDTIPNPGLTAKSALVHGAPAVRLPIPELVTLTMRAQPLLPVNQVVRVLQALADGEPIRQAMLAHIPGAK